MIAPLMVPGTHWNGPNFFVITFLVSIALNLTVIELTFDSISHANTYLDSPLLSEHNLSAYISFTLIISHDIIKLDTRLPEEKFREGLNCCVPVIAFKRISKNRDGILTPTRIFELKFLSPKIPSNLSSSTYFCMCLQVYAHHYNAITACVLVTLQNSAGATQDVAIVVIVSFSTCPSAQATDPCCIFCHPSHLHALELSGMGLSTRCQKDHGYRKSILQRRN